ncbi:putative beta-lysine N-acetyltransferase [Clostridium sp.]|mgnify:FL=1|uniref:putative beta-lysine N-acetyltransferase n=1 Tax=Clostridium sp. TaxID=1506 RepID=UPI002FDF0086
MNGSECKINNYYIELYGVELYVDYTNSRVKIIRFDNISIQIIRKIIFFASKEYLGKIICNCNTDFFESFLKAGFQLEGKIEGYFKGKDAYCMSYFIEDQRKLYSNSDKEDLILRQSLNIKNTFIHDNNFKYHIRNAVKSDSKEIAALFSYIFFTYPSPVFDEEYLKQTMNEKVLYKVAVDNGKIVSVASADMDKGNLNAEITDCATYPQYRSKGLLSNIIYSLESELKNMGFMTLYSLSRAIYPGINFVLSKHDYRFTGKLINNCNICGGFENMNIWVKNIRRISTDLCKIE